MTASDLIALLALGVSLFALGYTRMNAHATIGSNELTFRSEWLNAYCTMRKAQRSLSLSIGPFLNLTPDAARGYPLPLPERLVSKLCTLSWRAELWSNGKVYEHLKEALLWNRQLELHLESHDPEVAASSEDKAKFCGDALIYANCARREFGYAIDVVATRLRESAP